MNRALIFGAGLATTLVLTVLVLTGGHQPVPVPQTPRPGEAPLPTLDGVTRSSPKDTKNLTAPTAPAPATPVQN